ncbi:MAG TPA: TerB family tellurite resistance protein [Polyangiaceae bacterium]|nr:TerB family tellurite resistance protein [Polyangiaceae bacterium]
MRIRTKTIARLRDALLESGRRPTLVTSSAYETLARQGLLSPEELTALARVEPVAELMFLMMAADGNVHELERDALRGAIRGLAGDTLRSGIIQVMLESFEERLRNQGRLQRLHELAEELSEERADAESAFTLAAAIALADDHVADAENEFLNQVAEWLGLSTERANQVLDQLEQDAAE